MMEPQVYFFGTLPDGFSSYPGDHTRAFFEEFLKRSKNQLQIVVHREDNLLHYGYVRKFSNRYFGICICLDRIYNEVSSLFSILDNIYASMIRKGDILKLDGQKNIEWSLKSYASETVALNEYKRQIVDQLNINNGNSQPLPPIDFSISINDCLEISMESPNSRIIDGIKRYSNLYIVKKDSEIERVTGFLHVIETKNKDISKLKSDIQNQKRQISELSTKLTKARAQQRNIMWVSILGAIILILGVVIWNKVLYPSEVTHYETGEFVYYGPLKNNKPHGTGVAIYPMDDVDGRKYYIGNFVNGERQDTAAILFYQDGDYYYGSMQGDKWDKGILYMNSDNSHFTGFFKNDKPYSGKWYDHKELYKLVDGHKVSSNNKSR